VRDRKAKVFEAKILSTFAFLRFELWIEQQQIGGIGCEATQRMQMEFGQTALTKSIHDEPLHLGKLTDNAPGMQTLIVSRGHAS
jgi:hypothetical protein